MIATASLNHTFEGVEYLNVFFDQPYRLTAGQDYIAATMVYVPPSTYPPLLKYVNAVNLTQCGPGNITVMFSSASKEEMDDSNGSTVDEGRVPCSADSQTTVIFIIGFIADFLHVLISLLVSQVGRMFVVKYFICNT